MTIKPERNQQGAEAFRYPPAVFWYGRPPEKYWEGLPVGTSRFAAMAHGTPADEQITFNDETLWTGSPHNPNNPLGPEILKQARRLIQREDYEGADREILSFRSMPALTQCYQAMGFLNIRFDGHTDFSDYRRELDMDRAVVSIRYRCEGVTYTREIFASFPDQVVVIRLTADQPGKLSFSASFGSLHPDAKSGYDGSETLFIRGGVQDCLNSDGYAYDPVIPSRMKWRADLKITADGGWVTRDSCPQGERGVPGLRVTSADAATIVLAGATNYVNWQDISGNEEARSKGYIAAADKPYETLLERHLADYTPRFNRCRLFLGEDPNPVRDTTARLEAIRNGEPDPYFTALYFQYARYLLLAAAREGTLAFNNHNIWLDNLEGRWQGRWTLNINLQECYWPVESANLPEVNGSLLLFTKQLAEAGALTAAQCYGFRGWCAHHGVDIWMNSAFTGPSAHFGYFPLGGAWLCTQLFEHYLYDPDEAYLRELYPLLKGAALFCCDLLTQDAETGYLLTCPSTSPENHFLTPAGNPAGLSAGSAIDTQIIRRLFRDTIASAEALNTDTEWRSDLRSKLDKLPPHQVGKHGQLQEWFKDFDEREVTHRHVSHLFAAYPDCDITPESHPELIKAVRTALRRRGKINLGWSGAWKINLHARLGEPWEAYGCLSAMLGDVSIHPRKEDSTVTPSFEGNQAIQGVCAGIVEMLMQSHAGEIRLLPALPEQWPDGRVEGLRARGGFTVDIAWEKGRLVHAAITASRQGPCRVRAAVPFTVTAEGKALAAGDAVEFRAQAGVTYLLTV